MDKTAKIRQLNDACRTSFVGCQVVLTLGIRMKSEKEVADILERVRTFNDFNKNNDPYLEHDMGSFDYNGDKIMWKIDYYLASDMRYGSNDPADPAKTARVLTIMTSQDW